MPGQSHTKPPKPAIFAPRYAWEKSPDLSALLKTVAAAAKKFKPNTGRFIDDALVSNRHSRKTEYLRGLA